MPQHSHTQHQREEDRLDGVHFRGRRRCLVGAGLPIKPRRGQPRQARRFQTPSTNTTSSCNPSHSNFDSLSFLERLIQIGNWQRRYNMVRTRPQFRIAAVQTVSGTFQSCRPQDQVFMITFRGGFTIDGTFNEVMHALHSRIVEAVDASFEEDCCCNNYNPLAED
jgi:hypothetical protein